MKGILAAWLAIITLVLVLTIIAGIGALQRQAFCTGISGDQVYVTAEGLWLRQAVITTNELNWPDGVLIDTINRDARFKAYEFTTLRAGTITEKVR